MSTAHAKARLSKLIEEEDAELAIQLVQFAYFKKVLEKPGKRRKSQDGSGSEEEEDEEEAKKDTPSKRKRSEEDSDTPSKRKKVDPAVEAILEVEPVAPTKEVDQERYRHFMQLLHKCCAEKNQAQSLEIDVIRTFFAKAEKKNPFNNVSWLLFKRLC